MSTPPFDTAAPNVARMYDYWLGGTDNFEADRQAAEAVRKIRPNVAEQALDNKRFQTRAVTYVAGHGVRQFLDVGSGLPTSPVLTPGAEPQWLATHEAARRVMPDAMVAYVDHDSIAVQHSRVLLGDGHDAVVAVEADMRDPKAILADDELRAAGFDLDAPACVVLACVLHFVDAVTARGIASTFAGMLAPGSYLVISVGFGRGREGTNFASTYNAQNGPPIYSHSWEEITGLFDGLELVPPGIVETSEWLAGQPEGAVGDRESMIVAGVARRPLTRREAWGRKQLPRHHCPGTTGPAPLARHHCPGTTGPAPLARHHWPGTTGPAPLARHHWPGTTGPATAAMWRCDGYMRRDVTWVWLLWSEYRMQERAVLVVRVVQAVRFRAVRAGPVTTSM